MAQPRPDGTQELLDDAEDLNKFFLARATVEQRLSGLSLEDRLRGLTPEELVRGLTPEELVRDLTPEERTRILELLLKQQDR